MKHRLCLDDFIGLVGFEPTASWSRTRRSTKFSHRPFRLRKTAPQQYRHFPFVHRFYPLYASERMRTPQNTVGVFRKVGECLYRYSSNGVYYARFKADGKEIRRSLETTDRAEARRKLAAEKQKERQTDRSQGKLTLRELCDRYLKTIQDSKPKTLEQKSYVAERMKNQWPTGSLVQVAKIKPSDCDLW